MYYQLLRGVHLEDGNKYEVTYDRDAKTGAVHIAKQPIFESKRDLVSAFGQDKFRLVHEQEIIDSRRGSVEVGEGQKVLNIAPPPKTKEPPGLDVTEKFPEIKEYDKDGSLTIYLKRPRGYYIADKGELVTEVPLKRSELIEWIKAYKGE